MPRALPDCSGPSPYSPPPAPPVKFTISESGPASLGDDANGSGGSGGGSGPVYGAAYHPLGEDIGVSRKYP